MMRANAAAFITRASEETRSSSPSYANGVEGFLPIIFGANGAPVKQSGRQEPNSKSESGALGALPFDTILPPSHLEDRCAALCSFCLSPDSPLFTPLVRRFSVP